jgi:phage head maturation protease
MNKIVTKAAAEIRPADDDDESPNGAFDVILSAQSLDRDGETLKSTEWRDLPEHITFDIDHGMNVASTVGSGKPFINDNGDLQVRGTYSSIPRAQEVRALVNEGHIRTTSVAFLTHRDKKSNAVERELLNGAFVAIPANPDAVVLSSKALEIEVPAEAERNSLIISAKGIANSVEDLKDRLCDALCEAYPRDYPWIRATFIEGGGESGTVVYEIEGDTFSRSFTDDGRESKLGDDVTDVSIITTVVPENEDAGSDSQADEKSADVAEAAAEEAAADTKSADEVELRGRALLINFQSLGL